ncbi:hypothetical protein LEMLEM_LOCUS10210 [Lemmus lemmus]
MMHLPLSFLNPRDLHLSNQAPQLLAHTMKHELLLSAQRKD